MPVRGGGFIQGYNTQNVTSEDGLVIATELTDDPADCQAFEPMMRAAEDAAALIAAHRPAPDPDSGDSSGGQAGGPDEQIGLALADAGYCSEANLTCPGPDRLIATGKHRDLEKAARGGDTGQDRGGQAVQAMEHPGFGGDSILPRCSGLGGRCLPRYRRLAEPRSDHFPLIVLSNICPAALAGCPAWWRAPARQAPRRGSGISSSGTRCAPRVPRAGQG